MGRVSRLSEDVNATLRVKGNNQLICEFLLRDTNQSQHLRSKLLPLLWRNMICGKPPLMAIGRKNRCCGEKAQESAT
jgi:hypothetical protein